MDGGIGRGRGRGRGGSVAEKGPRVGSGAGDAILLGAEEALGTEIRSLDGANLNESHGDRGGGEGPSRDAETRRERRGDGIERGRR